MRILVLAFAALFCMASASLAAPPFSPGEQLDYVVKWEVIPAGEASLRVEEMTHVRGQDAYHFVATASSNDFVDAFYVLRNRIESFVAADFSGSLRYTEDKREGGYEATALVDFRPENGVVHYHKNDTLRKLVTIPEQCFDPLSLFYFFRAYNAPVVLGAEYAWPVSDGRKSVLGRARVVGRERVEVKAGEFEAWIIEPELTHLGGVFEESPDAQMRIWVSADERRLPLIIESKVVIGRVYAELAAYTPGSVP